MVLNYTYSSDFSKNFPAVTVFGKSLIDMADIFIEGSNETNKIESNIPSTVVLINRNFLT